MSTCDHDDYDAMLDRIAALQEEEALLARRQDRTSPRPGVPASFSVDLNGVRLKVEFEAIAS